MPACLQNLTGQAIAENQPSWFKRNLIDDDDDGVCGDWAARDQAARRRSAAFMALRDATVQTLEERAQGRGPWASGYWRTADRDMRILMCAETNTAANRLLESLVKLVGEDVPYEILRLGVLKDVSAWRSRGEES